MPRVLILGASGMLGHKLFQRLPAAMEVIGTTRQPNARLSAIARANGHVIDGVDVTDFSRVEELLRRLKPDVVVNCIGVIKQRDDGADAVSCISYNALLPHQLAAACKATGTRLILVSTDCVFSGRRGGYAESDAPDPVDLYGLTKLLGEIDGPNVLTLRTSMIGRELATHRSLLEWFLRQRGTVRGFTRAIFSGLTTPVMADELARVILTLPDLSGIYHVAARPLSKFHLLQMVKSQFDLEVEIIPDDSVQIDRSLTGERYHRDSGFIAPDWETMVAGLKDDSRWYDDHA